MSMFSALKESAHRRGGILASAGSDWLESQAFIYAFVLLGGLVTAIGHPVGRFAVKKSPQTGKA